MLLHWGHWVSPWRSSRGVIGFAPIVSGVAWWSDLRGDLLLRRCRRSDLKSQSGRWGETEGRFNKRKRGKYELTYCVWERDCIHYLSIDERTWGGCSWDWDSSEDWEADWNTHRHMKLHEHTQSIWSLSTPTPDSFRDENTAGKQEI